MDVCTGVHLIRCNDEFLMFDLDDQGLPDFEACFLDPFLIEQDHGKRGFIKDGVGDLDHSRLPDLMPPIPPFSDPCQEKNHHKNNFLNCIYKYYLI